MGNVNEEGGAAGRRRRGIMVWARRGLLGMIVVALLAAWLVYQAISAEADERKSWKFVSSIVHRSPAGKGCRRLLPL